MSKFYSICLWSFSVVALCAMGYPIYRSVNELDEPVPPAYHEYTVLDIETGTQMVMVGDDNGKTYKAKDTAWRDDHYLYENVEKAPKSGMKVVIVATYNKLYQ